MQSVPRARRVAAPWEGVVAGWSIDSRPVSARTAVAVVFLALAAITMLAVAIDVITGVSVAAFGWLYLLVILPVTIGWGRAAGLLTSVATLFLLVTFLTEPRGLPYTKSTVDLLRIGISMGGLAIAVFLIDHVNRRLASRDRLLAAIVSSAADAVSGEGVNGRIVSWSSGAERLYGFAAAEVLGQPLSLITPDGFADEMAGLQARLAQGERITHYETRRRTKDGRLLDVALVLSPIRDSEGRVTGAKAKAIDVTARKLVESALRRSEDELTSAMESEPDGLVLLDERGEMLLANESAQLLLGETGEPLRGEPFFDLLAKRFALHPAVRWRALIKAPASAFLAVDTRSTPLWLRVEVARITLQPSLHRAVFVTTLRDATAEIDASSRGLLSAEGLVTPSGARSGLPQDPSSSARASEGTAAAEPGVAGEPAPLVLTSREADVVRLIASGRSNLEIAAQLGITVNTVERHIANVYRKLRIRSRSQATVYALQHGLTPTAPETD